MTYYFCVDGLFLSHQTSNMKLRLIAEASNTPVLDGARALGELITYLKDNIKSYKDEFKRFNEYLKKPTLNSYKKVKDIINTLVSQAVDDAKGDIKPRKERWQFLLNMPDAIACTCAYAVDPTFARGTNLAPYTQSRSHIRQMMKTASPGGWVTQFAGAADINPSNTIRNLKNTARMHNLVRSSLTYMNSAGYSPSKPF